MNVLAVDSGNTRIKWGLHDGQGWTASGAVSRQETVRLNDALKALPAPSKIIIANVAGELIRSEILVLVNRWRLTPIWVVANAAQCGVTNGYVQPAQLGCDRWAALIGARQLHAGAAIVVMAGTATTMDALTADGRFLGGLILPGVDLMIEALGSKTANIRVDGGDVEAFPTSTRNAVWSAAVQATVGACQRLQTALIEAGEDAPAVLLSGGAGEVFAAYLPGPLVRVDNLVLEGLARMARDEDTPSNAHR